MKKILLVALAALFATAGAFAEFKKETGSIGIGLTNGVSDLSGYSADKMKLNLFFGYGWQLLGPIYVGAEINANVQKIGEDSSTSTTLTTTVISDGVGGTWSTYSSVTETLKVNYWNIDVSPRAYASLELTDMIMGQAYIGLNKNSFTYDSKVILKSDGSVKPGSTSSGTLYEAPWQAVMGLRGTISFLYLDYTRYFNLGSNKLKWSDYASDRITIGASFRF